MEAKKTSIIRWIVSRGLAFVGAVVCTAALFIVLPLLQAITNPLNKGDMLVREVVLEAPEPEAVPEEEIEEEEPPPPPPPPPQMNEAPPLDLAQLELALNPGGIGAGVTGDFSINIVEQLTGVGGSEELDKIFSLGELDQRPRAVFQRAPVYPSNMRRSGRAGTVYVLFIVDEQGRVKQPKVSDSTDAAFEQAALDAVKQWRFEPGTRQGEKVQFKIRIPITFNAG